MPGKPGGLKPMTRRQLVSGAIAAGAAAVAPAAGAEQPAKEAGVTEAEIAAAGDVTGVHYADKERTQMTRLATATREELESMREIDLDPTMDPAFRFDPLLPGRSLPGGKSSCKLSRAEAGMKEYSGSVESLAFARVSDMARLVKARKVTSVQLTQMFIARIKRYAPKLHCLINLCEERAMEHAARADKEIAAGNYRGPLHGIPWGAKDLLATKGVPTTWGAKPYERQMFDYDATVVERLDAAGAVLIAKLSMGELAMGDVWFGGLTRNPWSPDKGSSGSSAGPGSATAAGLTGFTIGTETLGSIVSPSVVNGVSGLRPSFGRVSRYGAMPLSWTMDKIGPMCRGVEDCALVLAAIHGPDGKDRTLVNTPFRWDAAKPLAELRIGINQSAFDEAGKDAARAKIYRDALDVIKSLGVRMRKFTPPAWKDAYDAIAETTINCEGAASFGKLNRDGGLAQLAQQGNNNWPNIFRVGSLTPAADYIHAMRLRKRVQQEWDSAIGDLDAVVSVPFARPVLVCTNLTGHPTLITRCGLNNGLPVSIEFVGGLYKEAEILRLGLAFEQATKWHTQWPDMSKLA